MKINLFNIKYLFISLIFYSNIVFGQKNTDNTTKDSIDTWIKKSRKTSLQLTKRNTFLDKAYNRVNKLDNNIYKSKTLSTIAYRYYTIKDTISFKKINAETLQLATQLKDTCTIADSHWSYAYFYNNQQKYNAAFYHYNNAFEGFKKLNDKYKSARMLYAMAFIKGR